MISRTSECISREFTGLGTVNSVCIYGCTTTELLDLIQQRVLELENKLSVFRPRSEIWKLNQNAGKSPVAVSDETFRVLTIAKKFSALSGGAFAVTIRPLVSLWGIGKKENYIPEPEKIKAAKELVNDRDLILDETERTAFLSMSGQGVDLGGIAKGYAADEIRRILTQAGVKSALINLGGNIVTVGCRPDGQPWRIGIQNPAAVRGHYFGTVSARDKTVVTSGRNERFFLKDGVCYHHLIDPRTGRPSDSGLLSVTVIGGCSMEADALTTAVFVLGIQNGMKLLKLRNADAVFATDDYKIYLTQGIIHQFGLEKELQHMSGDSK